MMGGIARNTPRHLSSTVLIERELGLMLWCVACRLTSEKSVLDDQVRELQAKVAQETQTTQELRR